MRVLIKKDEKINYLYSSLGNQKIKKTPEGVESFVEIIV